jgi:hypothetical protein
VCTDESHGTGHTKGPRLTLDERKPRLSVPRISTEARNIHSGEIGGEIGAPNKVGSSLHKVRTKASILGALCWQR